MPRRPDRSVTGGATVDAVGRGRALTTCGAGSPARRPAPTRCRMPGGSRASSDGRGERPGRPPRTAAGRGGGRAGNRRHLSAAGDRLGFSRGSVAVRRRDGREAPPLERSWPGAGLTPPGEPESRHRAFSGRLREGGRVEERRVAGRGSVAYPALSQPGRRPIPVGTFPPPALRTRRADFRHRALQWNHAARTRASRSRPAGGSREPWHQARTLAPAGRCVVRPVDALATATARVVPFACACDDIRHSCSSPG